ncbi:MAG: PAS domain S-box protein [Archaeoglobus sp.]|nr:PAS domain S-box protein [Archaeoglobus sp.]
MIQYLELSDELLDRILRGLEEAIILAEAGGKILSVTPAISKMIGFEPKELVSKNFLSFVHPDDADLAVKAFHSPGSVEVRLAGKKGTRWVKIRSDALSDKNLILIILKDVSKLKEKEDLLSKLEEKTHTGIYIVQEERFVYVNRKLAELTGYSVEELLEMNPFDLVHPDHLSLVRERYLKREMGEDVPEHYEWKIVTKDGSERWIEVIATKIEFNGKPAVLGNVFDITHRKQMEERLRKSERKFRNLLEAIKDTLFVIDTEGRFVFLNKKFEDLTLFSVDEWLGRHFLELIAPEYRKTVVENFKKGIAGESIPPYEIEILRKDGKRVFAELNVTNIYENGKIVGRIGIARDISERKEIEKKLMESEKMFRKLAEKSLIGIYLIQDGVFKYVNPRLAELWGYSVEELIGRSPLEFIHPADRELVDKNLRLRIEGRMDSINYKLRMIRKDGETRINEVYGSRITYNGRPAIIGTLIDITDSEKYREELERYKRFYENAHDLFFILDSKARFVEVNPRYAELLGYKKGELIGHTARKLMDPAEVERVREMFKKVMKGNVVRYEAKAIPKDRKKVYLMEVTLWPIFEKGKVVGAEGIVRDITERKKLEDRLRKSEKKYRRMAEYLQNLINVAPVPITSWDSEYRITLWNKAAEENFGWKAEEVIGKNILEVHVPEEERRRVKKVLDKVEEGNSVVNINPCLTKNGERRIFEWYNFAIGKGKDKITTSIGIDLTERIEMEKMLIENERKFRKLFETTPNLAAILDENGTFIEVNPAMIKSIGFNPIGRKLTEIFPNEVAEKRMSYVKEAIEKNKRIDFEDTRKNRHFHNIFIPLALKGKRYCFVVARDVTGYIRLNKLLTAINEINKLIVYEKNRKSLLEKACRILSSLREYYSVWLGLIEEDRLIRIAGEEMHPVDFLIEELPSCFEEAMKSVRVVKSDEKLKICPFPESDLRRFNCTIVPMRAEKMVRGFVVIHSKETLPEREEIEMLQTLADDLAFAIKAIELEEARKKAFQQIEKNIEQYAILVDQIRNPLAIIAGLAELKASEELRREITEQVDRIERLIQRLDRGWLESESVREFLRRTSR